MNMTMKEALVLSEALSQYLENQPHPEEVEPDLPQPDLATAQRLLDIADTVIANAACNKRSLLDDLRRSLMPS